MRDLFNFPTYVSILRGYSAGQFKMVCNEEENISSTSTQILESVYGISKVNINAIE